MRRWLRFRGRMVVQVFVVGTVVQRAHYFGVSKTLKPITDPQRLQGPENRYFARTKYELRVAKRMLKKRA